MIDLDPEKKSSQKSGQKVEKPEKPNLFEKKILCSNGYLTYSTVLVPPAVLVSLAKDKPKLAKSVEILIFENSKGTFGNFIEASGGISRHYLSL